MLSCRLCTRIKAVLAVSTLTLLASITPAAAQQETVLHSFPSSTKDGYEPFDTLIMDAAGNLYGTASYSATGCPQQFFCGIVFELMPAAGGGWTEKILHTFGKGTDGNSPYSGLIFDEAGNLYGTTAGGGTLGAGTVFELSPKAGGIWTEKILHNFSSNGIDGVSPEGTLVFDAAGNLYGTTLAGGSHFQGAVFELTHSAAGGWIEKILHNFNDNGVDGVEPQAGLIFDSAGNLYGTTPDGGAYGYGTAFMLKHLAGGGWTEKNLHNFNDDGIDGNVPLGSLIFDASGNLYGTTWIGGVNNYGTVYKLTLTAGGSWNETVLYNFGQNPIGDGVHPAAGLIFDAAGNLYGTTLYGGAPYNEGTVFELMPSGGNWTETLLYSFGAYLDGTTPYSGLVFDKSGHLYGTTYMGGSDATGQVGGTVFEITP